MRAILACACAVLLVAAIPLVVEARPPMGRVGGGGARPSAPAARPQMSRPSPQMQRPQMQRPAQQMQRPNMGQQMQRPAQQMQRGCTRERLLQLQLLPLLLLTLAVCAALNGSNCADSGQYMHACCRLAHREVEEVGLLWV